MIKAELVARGVAPEAVLVVPKEEESVDTALNLARPNDLVLIFCDGITRCWKRIIYFHPVEKAAPVPPERRVAASGFDVPEGYRIVSDERGVRIAPL